VCGSVYGSKHVLPVLSSLGRRELMIGGPNEILGANLPSCTAVGVGVVFVFVFMLVIVLVLVLVIVIEIVCCILRFSICDVRNPLSYRSEAYLHPRLQRIGTHQAGSRSLP
jgi:hypothetical protein